MNFKFAGKFVLTARAMVEAFLGNFEWHFPLTQVLTLDANTSNISFSGVGSHHFTIWQPVEAPALGGDGSTSFILRAQNGLYLTEQNGRLTANAQNQAEALMFVRYPLGPNNWMYEFQQQCGPPITTESGKLLVMNVVARNTYAAQLVKKYDLPDIPPGTLEGVTPALRQKYTGIRFDDITPSLDAIRGANGPVDLSWLYWPNVILSNCNLPNSNLKGAVLSGANIRYTQLVNSDLTLVDLSSAALEGTTLTNVKVDGALFSRANLSRCSFIGVDFRNVGVAGDRGRLGVSGANFMGADLTDANFAGCDLTNTVFATDADTDRLYSPSFQGTDFSDTVLSNDPIPNVFQRIDSDPRRRNWGDDMAVEPELSPFDYTPQFSTNPDKPTKFRNATLTFNLIHLNWSCLDLTNATINGLPQDLSGLQASHLIAPRINVSNRILKNAVFDYADLTGANFADADLTGASFQHAKLSGANFSYAMLDNANFNQATLGNVGDTGAAVLSYANMRNADFSYANLDNCYLDYVQWYGGKATGFNATMQGAHFANANLSGVNLEQAKCRNANFANAILVGAQLKGADAVGADFTQAHLQGANFTRATLNAAHFTGGAVALEHGVPLFVLDPASDRISINDLNNSAYFSPALSKAFQKHKCLLNKPTIKADTPDKPGQWIVSSDSNAPQTGELGAAYATFQIVTVTDGFQVYGNKIWITQVNDDASRELTGKHDCAKTILVEGQCTLGDDTTFPSGYQYLDYKQSLYTWEKMMTANEPLAPPPCISTGNDWSCPANKRS